MKIDWNIVLAALIALLAFSILKGTGILDKIPGMGGTEETFEYRGDGE